ncbi:hypothetical protein ABIA39_004489 [Nocardia sp. GAS34]
MDDEISERIAFDTLTLWGGLVGFFLWPAAGRRSR